MTDRATPGRFVTLEGGEGAGKSTQLRRLVDRLSQRGVRALATREPGGSPRAEEIRSLVLSGKAAPFGPVAEALLFSAARADHLAATIRPALARGEWVVCDRFADSTRAYQGAAGGLDPKVVNALERIVVGETKPDLTLILDLPPEQGLARAAARRGKGDVDRFENEALAFHATLRNAFIDIARREPERCVVIDAARGEDEVAQAVWTAVESRLLRDGDPATPADAAHG